jgi:anti-sigma B factor antagonist
MELAISTSGDSAGVPVVHLDGALDLMTRNTLVAAVEKVFSDSDSPTVVLDVAAVTFIDSTGVGALVQMASDAEDQARQLVLRNPSARVARILQLTGLQDRFAVDVEPQPGTA